MKRLGVLGITMMMLAGVLTAAVLPGVASASCKGYNYQDYETFTYNGVLRAEEWAVDGTCNGNDYYQGRLNDSAADHRYVALKRRQQGDTTWETVARAGGKYGNNVLYDLRGGSDYYQVFKFCLIVEPGYSGNAICDQYGFENLKY